VNQNKKAETTIKVKEMDIQAKGALQHQEHVHQHKLSREEVLKQLVDGKDVIEVDTDTSTLSSAD
ncbi:MAG: hypothetical protein EBV86_18050, partial [Marivivens sp.]|nr:hypothetical protein [Marivivens sp.]